MKKLIIFIFLSLFIYNTGFSGIPVIDPAAILSETTKILNKINEYKGMVEKYSYWNIWVREYFGRALSISIGFLPKEMMEKFKTYETLFSDMENFIKYSNYFRDLDRLETWRDIFNRSETFLEKYKYVQNDTPIKNNIIYRNNSIYKKYADKLIELRDQQIQKRLDLIELLSDYRELGNKRIEKIETISKKLKKSMKASGECSLANETGMYITLYQIKLMKILIKNQIATLMLAVDRNKLEYDLRISKINKDYENEKSDIDYKKLLKIETK